jgi:hypothetical protein
MLTERAVTKVSSRIRVALNPLGNIQTGSRSMNLDCKRQSKHKIDRLRIRSQRAFAL